MTKPSPCIRKFVGKLADHLTSRKLWMMIAVLVWARWDFWAVCSMLYSFEKDAQVTGFVALATIYLGFVTALVRGYFTANSKDKIAAQQTPTP